MMIEVFKIVGAVVVISSGILGAFFCGIILLDCLADVRAEDQWRKDHREDDLREKEKELQVRYNERVDAIARNAQAFDSGRSKGTKTGTDGDREENAPAA